MLLQKILIIFTFWFTSVVAAEYPEAALLTPAAPSQPWLWVDAVGETDPIPWSTKDTDDAAIWLRVDDPEKSLILGTSKLKPTGDRSGGLGVYDLSGRERQFLLGGKLNNVDTTQVHGISQRRSSQWAMATNRSTSETGLDLFRLNASLQMEKVTTLPLLDTQGRRIEPYGLCIARRAPRIEVFITTKAGILYRYHFTDTPSVSITLLEEMNLALGVSAEDDQVIHMVVEKAAKAEDELDELPEKIAERFTLEGCSYDSHRDRLFVGMENLGIWSMALNTESPPVPQLFLKISGSWTDIEQWGKDATQPRITDDIEGMEVFHHRGQDFLLFSNQGISEFSLVELSQGKLVGNVKFRLGDDIVTHTDGVTIAAHPMGSLFPDGIVVVHDDQNTAPNGSIERANYKIVSLRDLLRSLHH